MQYKTIIFDFGGVILNIDYELTAKALDAISNRVGSTNFSQNEQDDFFDKFERGEISSLDFRSKLKVYLNTDISDDVLDSIWNKMLLDLPQKRIEWILRLKEKYRCVLLSNTNQIHYDAFTADLEKLYGYKKFSDLFHKTYFSHEIGMRKPETRIYNYVLNDLNIQPSELLFIDDTKKNIEAAKKLNWNCILWQNKELDELL